MSSEHDLELMRLAIAVGEKGKQTTPPNPWVGCVIAAEGKVVTKGFHQSPGKPHAEIEALNSIGGRLPASSTVYCTLEPCSHFGRTPPCVEALIAARPKRVVIGIKDPDPQVAGEGIIRLKEAGIDVAVGIAEKEVTNSLRAYILHRTRGTPFCLLKLAASVDGRVAAKDGSSRWISCPEARNDAQRLRAESQAVMVGAGTAYFDQPRLTVRDESLHISRQPLRVVLDSSGRLSPPAPLLDVTQAPTLIFTSEDCSKVKLEQWRGLGVEISQVPRSQKNGLLELSLIMKELAKRGVLQVMAEGGSHLHTNLVKEGYADQLSIYIGPMLLGCEGIPVMRQLGIASIENARKLELKAVEALGRTVRMDYFFTEPAVRGSLDTPSPGGRH